MLCQLAINVNERNKNPFLCNVFLSFICKESLTYAVLIVMKWRIAVSAYVVGLVYFLGILIWGNTGFVAYAGLEKVYAAMSDNLSELSIKRKKLEDKLTLLSTSAEQIRQHAKSLFLLDKDRGIIIVKGIQPPSQNISPGTVIYPVSPDRDNTPLIRAIALSAGLIVFILTWLIEPVNRSAEDKKQNTLSDSAHAFRSMRRASR